MQGAGIKGAPWILGLCLYACMDWEDVKYGGYQHSFVVDEAANT